MSLTPEPVFSTLSTSMFSSLSEFSSFFFKRKCERDNSLLIFLITFATVLRVNILQTKNFFGGNRTRACHFDKAYPKA